MKEQKLYMANLFWIGMEGSYSTGRKDRYHWQENLDHIKIRVIMHRFLFSLSLCLSSAQQKSRAHNSDASLHFLKLAGRNPSHRG